MKSVTFSVAQDRASWHPRQMHPTRSLVIAGSLLLPSACSYVTTDPDTSECVVIPGVEDCDINEQETGGSESSSSGDSGETGGGSQGEEPEAFPPGECQFNEVLDDSSDFGWKIQCEGHLYASIDFHNNQDDCLDLLDETQCTEHHEFGPGGVIGDTYDDPGVMACCGPYVPEARDEYLRYCSYDLIQQVCGSIATRLQKLVQDKAFGLYNGQGAKLQQWVAQHYSECFTTLLANDSDLSPGGLTSSWSIPNNNDWPAIEDFIIRVDEGTEVTGLMQPGDMDEWQSCRDATQNNDNIFEGSTPPPGGVFEVLPLAGPVGAALRGPELLGGEVRAQLEFSPDCAIQGCSRALLGSLDGAANSPLTVHDFTLYADTFIVTNQNGAQLSVDALRLSLFDAASAELLYDLDGQPLGYQIAPGAAIFVLAPSAAGVHNQFLARNSTALRLRKVDEAWLISAFELSYTDDAQASWIIEVGSSRWQ